MALKILFEDKINIREKTIHNQELWAEDVNAIKKAINENADETVNNTNHQEDTSKHITPQERAAWNGNIPISRVTDLQAFINTINSLIASDDVNLDELQEVVNYIKANRDDLANLSINNIAGLVAALATKVTLNPIGSDNKFFNEKGVAVEVPLGVKHWKITTNTVNTGDKWCKIITLNTNGSPQGLIQFAGASGTVSGESSNGGQIYITKNSVNNLNIKTVFCSGNNQPFDGIKSVVNNDNTVSIYVRLKDYTVLEGMYMGSSLFLNTLHTNNYETPVNGTDHALSFNYNSNNLNISSLASKDWVYNRPHLRQWTVTRNTATNNIGWYKIANFNTKDDIRDGMRAALYFTGVNGVTTNSNSAAGGVIYLTKNNSSTDRLTAVCYFDAEDSRIPILEMKTVDINNDLTVLYVKLGYFQGLELLYQGNGDFLSSSIVSKQDPVGGYSKKTFKRWHSQNLSPQKTIDTATTQTSETLNNDFPVSDNPINTKITNLHASQPFTYVRVTATMWRAVNLGDVI